MSERFADSSKVSDPQGSVINSQYKRPQGSFSISADKGGKFTFNVHGQLYMGDDERIAPVEQEVRDLSAGLQLVKDEQAYLVVRERIHRDTCESTNSRVKWWAIVQSLILLGVCGWNIHYLKSWFEVKRVL
nr:COPII-coated vesicle protein [Cryptococcus depauperatus CBS 7855]